eukprot:6187172-Pleurochrysis_carterae.AAC.3
MKIAHQNQLKVELGCLPFPAAIRYDIHHGMDTLYCDTPRPLPRETMAAAVPAGLLEELLEHKVHPPPPAS